MMGSIRADTISAMSVRRPVHAHRACAAGSVRRRGRRPVRLSYGAALACVAALVGGCGGTDGNGGGAGSDEAAIRRVADEFVKAANARDWKEVCTLFSPDAIAQAESLGVTCEQSFEQRNRPGERISEHSVEDIRVDGDRATAVLKGTNTVEGPTEATQGFEKVDGEWKMGLADSGGSP